MTRHRQSRLGAVLLAAIVAAAGMCLHADDQGYTTNCYDIVSGEVLHIRCTEDAALDFAVQSFGTNGWRIVAASSGGWCDVEIGVVGALLRYAYTTNKSTVTGSGDVFRFMFKSWGWDDCQDHYVRSMGWMTLAVVDDMLVILAGEFTTQSGVSLVGRGDPTVPELPTEGVIWKCDFNGFPEYGIITNDADIGRHVAWTSSRSCSEFCSDPFWGRACADVGMARGDRLSFFVNEMSDGKPGVPVVPAKWEVLSSLFAFNQFSPCEPDEPLYAEGGNLPSLRLFYVMGGMANIDDKIALRFCSVYDDWYEDVVGSRWELNAGFPDPVSGELVAQTVELASSDALTPLPDATNRWTVVEIEAINDGSPLGLAYRIYIDGILACSSDDGATVFRARPEAASDRNGVAALCFGGCLGVDDIVFRRRTIEPLAGVNVEPAGQFTADELSNLAGIIGLDRLRGVDSIALYEWDALSVGAPKLCVQLGLSPFDVKTDGGTKLMLGFKNPTVMAIAIDPVAHTVAGRVIPAMGTRIVQSPMPYMFGINQHIDFGTPYEHIEEYGLKAALGVEGFTVETSSYAVSNGVFALSFPADICYPGSTFFSLSVKDYSR
ncbi:MAG: hypothetical protein IKU71_06740 [Kiritimatiellae bacterium]|nr:hypothetical protein [Kiritimatiellia bacterium]